MKAVAIVVLGAASMVASAQSTFQDARGNSSLLLPTGGYAQIAFDKSSARIGFQHDTSGRTFYGVDLSGKLRVDSANLFSDGKLTNDVRLQLAFGLRLQHPLSEETAPLEHERDRLLSRLESDTLRGRAATERLAHLQASNPPASAQDLASAREEVAQTTRDLDEDQQRIDRLEEEIRAVGKTAYQTLALQVEGRSATYKLFDATQPFGSQFHNERFEGWGLNVLLNGLLPGIRYGLSVGFERDNNIDDLTLQDFIDRQTWVDNGVTRTSEKKTSAYVGDYQIVDRVPIRADFVWWPGNLRHQVGLTFYGRYDARDSSSFRPGVGIFLCKPGAPTAVIGGLTVLFDHGNPEAAIVAGYSF